VFVSPSTELQVQVDECRRLRLKGGEHEAETGLPRAVAEVCTGVCTGRTFPTEPSYATECLSEIAPFLQSEMGRAGIEPATLGLRVPCSTS
jgi:hypothetical protein